MALRPRESDGQGLAPCNGRAGLRSESVRGQLDGTIPATDEGQSADPGSLVDASDLTLSALGTMNNGGGRGGFPGGVDGAQEERGEHGGFPGGSGGGASDGSGGGSPGGESADASLSGQDLVLLGCCAAVMLPAIVFAKRFRAVR